MKTKDLKSNNPKRKKAASDDFTDLEKGFLIQLSLAAVLFSVISVIANIVMGFSLSLILVTVLSTLIFAIYYYLIKKDIWFGYVKWLFIATVLIIINLIWFYNYGSHGPWFYLIVLLYSYLIFMMKGRQLLVVSILLIVDVVVLFLFEYNFPGRLGDYPDAQARIIDIYTAIILYGAVAFILMTLAKHRYLTAYQKAKESDRLKSSFLANMSHEIRTPLNAIVGFSNLLAEDVDEEEKQQYIDIINQSNTSLLRLIDDVLDVSLIEADQLKIKSAEFCVNNLIDNLEKTYNKVLSEKAKTDVKIEVKIPPEKIFITSDMSRINQVMVNLLDNAIKFTHNGYISFGFSREGDILHFFVADSGIGIKREYQEALFERFFKVEENKDKLYRGTGIGLYLCKKIVGIFGGRIWFESDFGKGSVFHFTLPATGMRVEAEVVTKKEDIELPAFNFPGATILIVEDDKSSLIYLSRMLAHMGLHILEAVNGNEALEIFKANPEVDLVLLDIRLPDKSGFEVIKEMKEINDKIPVIAQTAFALVGDEKKCYEAGFDDYIAKPIPKNILLEKLSFFLGKSS